MRVIKKFAVMATFAILFMIKDSVLLADSAKEYLPDMSLETLTHYKTVGLCYEGINADDFDLASQWCSKITRYDRLTYYYLGYMYYEGKGFKKDHKKAFSFTSKSAKDGEALSQYLLGLMYEKGHGVEKNPKKANAWFKRSALQGHAQAQAVLGYNYFYGAGLPIDYILAYKWLNLANASDEYELSNFLNDVRSNMTKGQVAIAQQMSREFVAVEENYSNRDVNDSGKQKLAKIKTGTGFVLNSKGHVATSYHVVNDCQQIKAKKLPNVETKPWDIDWDTGRRNYIHVKLLSYDKANDLAILAFPGEYNNYAYLETKNTLQLGSQVVVAGYPVPEVLSDNLRISVGEVNSLVGIKGDDSKYQISASIQKGNSGSPLLNKVGSVVGVIHSTIDSDKYIKHTGDLPQHLNFAVDIKYLVELLESSKIAFSSREKSTEESIDSVASIAKKYTTVIECWGY